MLSILVQPHPQGLAVSQGDVDSPGNSHRDSPWAHTGLDRAFKDHSDVRKIRMFSPELTLFVLKNRLYFEVAFFLSSSPSSFLILSFKNQIVVLGDVRIRLFILFCSLVCPILKK